jgi:hypothetical protein
LFDRNLQNELIIQERCVEIAPITIFIVHSIEVWREAATFVN